MKTLQLNWRSLMHFATLGPRGSATGSQERRARSTTDGVGENRRRLERKFEESDPSVGGIEDAVVSPASTLPLT